MTLESDANFEEELTLGFKNGMANLVNFSVSRDKSKNSHLDMLLFSIASTTSAKKVHKSYLT